MKGSMNKGLIAAVLCLTLLLSGSLGYQALQGIFGQLEIVRTQSPEEPLQNTAGQVAYFYGSSNEMDPVKLYELAERQTVIITTYTNTDSEGNVLERVMGSGFVISYDGYILTNCHVVSEANDLGLSPTVSFRDGSSYEAEIIGCDNVSDVALLKIAARCSSVSKLGNSSKIKPCQTIYIMGHPAEELAFTMTSGIISGLDREIEFDDGIVLNMFQIDAAVNRGNSGGPVYNEAGEVIGITTAKYTGITAEGLGFAIPINDALKIAEDLKEYGYVRFRPLMGITVTNVTLDQFEGGSPAGAMVYDISPGLCGEKAGLQKGDIIIQLGDTPVTSIADLTKAKLPYNAGDTAELKVWRYGEIITLYITFDEVDPDHPTGSVEITPEEEPEAEEEPKDEAGETPEEQPEEAPGEENGTDPEVEDSSPTPEKEPEIDAIPGA